jgi:hypothetical protein
MTAAVSNHDAQRNRRRISQKSAHFLSTVRRRSVTRRSFAVVEGGHAIHGRLLLVHDDIVGGRDELRHERRMTSRLARIRARWSFDCSGPVAERVRRQARAASERASYKP